MSGLVHSRKRPVAFVRATDFVRLSACRGPTGSDGCVGFLECRSIREPGSPGGSTRQTAQGVDGEPCDEGLRVGEFDGAERCRRATAFGGRRLAACDGGEPKSSLIVEAIGEFFAPNSRSGLHGSQARAAPSSRRSRRRSVQLRQRILHRRIGRPLAGAGDDQVGRFEGWGLLAREGRKRRGETLHQADRRQARSDAVGERPRLAGAHRQRAEFVPADVFPAEVLGVDEVQVFDAGLREHSGYA